MYNVIYFIDNNVILYALILYLQTNSIYIQYIAEKVFIKHF